MIVAANVNFGVRDPAGLQPGQPPVDGQASHLLVQLESGRMDRRQSIRPYARLCLSTSGAPDLEGWNNQILTRPFGVALGEYPAPVRGNRI